MIEGPNFENYTNYLPTLRDSALSIEYLVITDKNPKA